MKNQIVTVGIVLNRTDFGEADRILTVLTPDNGKLRMIAKGVRRPRSKLAGGIELLSVNNLTILPGRGEMGTLVSSRLITHFGNIVEDLDRTMLSYNLLKRVNRATEDAASGEYFLVLKGVLEGLNDAELPADLAELWFNMQLLNVSGHLPNMRTDTAGQKLKVAADYSFDFEHMAFRARRNGDYNANQIKLLRLAYSAEQPLRLKQVTDAETYAPKALRLSANLLRLNIRI